MNSQLTVLLDFKGYKETVYKCSHWFKGDVLKFAFGFEVIATNYVSDFTGTVPKCSHVVKGLFQFKGNIPKYLPSLQLGLKGLFLNFNLAQRDLSQILS